MTAQPLHRSGAESAIWHLPGFGTISLARLRVAAEPLASCMPCLTNPSGTVRDNRLAQIGNALPVGTNRCRTASFGRVLTWLVTGFPASSLELRHLIRITTAALAVSPWRAGISHRNACNLVSSHGQMRVTAWFVRSPSTASSWRRAGSPSTSTGGAHEDDGGEQSAYPPRLSSNHTFLGRVNAKVGAHTGAIWRCAAVRVTGDTRHLGLIKSRFIPNKRTTVRRLLRLPRRGEVPWARCTWLITRTRPMRKSTS